MSEIFYTTGEAHESLDVLYVRDDDAANLDIDNRYNLIDGNLNTEWGATEGSSPIFNIGHDIIVEVDPAVEVNAFGMWINNGDTIDFNDGVRFSIYGSDDITVDADPQHADNWEVDGFYAQNLANGYGQDRPYLFFLDVQSTISPVGDKYDQDSNDNWYLKYKYYRFRIWYGAGMSAYVDLSQIYLMRKHTLTKNYQRPGSFKEDEYDNSSAGLHGKRELVSRNYTNPITVFKRPYHLIGSSQITVGENIYDRSRGRAYPFIYQPGTNVYDAYVCRLNDNLPPVIPLDHNYSKIQCNFKSEPHGD